MSMRFDRTASPLLKTVILDCFKKGNRIRVFFGDMKTGKVRIQTHAVIGVVKADKQAPVLHCTGGGSSHVNNASVLCIIDVRTKKTLYSVPNIQFPKLIMAKGESPSSPFEVFEVESDNANCLHARFPTESKAQAWMNFMTGKAMKK